MAFTDELDKLDELHRRGALSDEEFARAKARLLDGQPAAPQGPAIAALNALRRSTSDRWIGGVCGGLGRATAVEPWVWRLLFAVLFFCGGVGLVLYVLMWIIVPTE